MAGQHPDFHPTGSDRDHHHPVGINHKARGHVAFQRIEVSQFDRIGARKDPGCVVYLVCVPLDSSNDQYGPNRGSGVLQGLSAHAGKAAALVAVQKHKRRDHCLTIMTGRHLDIVLAVTRKAGIFHATGLRDRAERQKAGKGKYHQPGQALQFCHLLAVYRAGLQPKAAFTMRCGKAPRHSCRGIWPEGAR